MILLGNKTGLTVVTCFVLLIALVGGWALWQQDKEIRDETRNNLRSSLKKFDSRSTRPSNSRLIEENANETPTSGGTHTSAETIESSHTPSLQFEIHGVEALLVDAQGRRVGYDPVSGQVVNEISNAMYINAEIVPPGAEPTGIIKRTLFVSEHADGSYRLLVIARPTAPKTTDPSPASAFNISTFGFDRQFHRSEMEVYGKILPGEVVEYQVQFLPDEGKLLIE